MDIADSCFTMIMECHLWQCTGNIVLIIWLEGTMTFTGCRCQTAMHWQHRFNHMVGRYNDIYRVQMPNITPHVCRHTYCSNMAKSGMNPKTLQYLMGHSDISVTMNVYTHIGFDDAEEELKRIEEFRKARAEVEQKKEKPMSQKMFKVI